jgi:cytochrome c biogenesis protein CcmG, thiol:disulfide interchange protein DsbE
MRSAMTVPLATALALLLAAASAGQDGMATGAREAHATQMGAPVIGEPAPALKGTLLSGGRIDLAALRGKVVLINFYSSYCKYCAYEIGNVETFLEQQQGRGFEVIVIGIDPLEDRQRVQRMLGIYNLPGAMVQELNANGFGERHPTPTAYVIDRKGNLRSKHWGAKTPAYFREAVLPLLAESG